MFKRPDPKIDVQLQSRTAPRNLGVPRVTPTLPRSPLEEGAFFRAPSFARNKMMAEKTGEVIKVLAERRNQLDTYFPNFGNQWDRNGAEARRLAKKEIDSRIKAAGFYQMEKQIQQINQDIDADYIAEFRDFLLGKSKYNNVIHWGRRKLIGDDIDRYLEAVFDKKAEFDKLVLKFKTTGYIPSNLDEAWFYFNFILKHPDITGEQIEATFLKPWEAFYPAPLSPFSPPEPGGEHDSEPIYRMGGLPENRREAEENTISETLNKNLERERNSQEPPHDYTIVKDYKDYNSALPESRDLVTHPSNMPTPPPPPAPLPLIQTVGGVPPQPQEASTPLDTPIKSASDKQAADGDLVTPIEGTSSVTQTAPAEEKGKEPEENIHSESIKFIDSKDERMKQAAVLRDLLNQGERYLDEKTKKKFMSTIRYLETGI